MSGGIEHKYWQHRIKDWFEKHDYASKLEFQNLDVYGLVDDHDVAVEVAMEISTVR